MAKLDNKHSGAYISKVLLNTLENLILNLILKGIY